MPVGEKQIPRAGLVAIILPESYIQMMLEIKENHPVLWMVVSMKPDISEVLGEVGAYLQVPMDGEYVVGITAGEFYRRLRALRGAIILR